MIRLTVRLCALALLMLTTSCEAQHKPPYLMYRAQFEVANVDEAVILTRAIATKWGLSVRELDRDQMSFHTRGKPAFFTALMYKDDPVVVVNNSGFGEVIMVIAVNFERMPTSDLEALTAEIIRKFQARFDMDFEKMVESTAKIDVTK